MADPLDNVNTNLEEIKATVFVKMCQTPPDYVGIFRIIQDQLKKISDTLTKNKELCDHLSKVT